MPPGSDAPLVAALRAGDPAAFSAVYARYRTSLYGFLRRAARRDDVAEDLVQETWMALARSATSLRADTDLGAWIFTVARNALRSHQRWARIDLSRWVAFTDDACAAPTAGPDVATSRSRLVLAVEEALIKMPSRHREVLLLVGVEGLEQEQVAKVLGVSYEALRQRLSRARAALAELLAPHIEEEDEDERASR